MQITEISVLAHEKRNLGDYSSCDAEASLTAMAEYESLNNPARPAPNYAPDEIPF